ncbi:MAG: helix-turn-helix domain-containing protein [Bacillota bacterium]
MSYKSIGKQLQLAREEAGYSQEQLASKIGCSQSTLSNYEKGKRRIYLAQLETIAEVLKRPVEFFLRNTDNSVAHSIPDDTGGRRVQPQEQWNNKGCEESGPPGSDDERALIESYRSLSAEGKNLVLGFTEWVKKREVAGGG